MYPHDKIASNEPGMVFDGVDMGGVEVAPTKGAQEVPGIQSPVKKLNMACRPLSLIFFKKHRGAHINIACKRTCTG